jgi:hypothetical protein
LAAQLAELFSEHQYAHDAEDRSAEARSLWKRMKRPLWLMRLSKKIMK